MLDYCWNLLTTVASSVSPEKAIEVFLYCITGGLTTKLAKLAAIKAWALARFKREVGELVKDILDKLELTDTARVLKGSDKEKEKGITLYSFYGMSLKFNAKGEVIELKTGKNNNVDLWECLTPYERKVVQKAARVARSVVDKTSLKDSRAQVLYTLRQSSTI